MVKISIQGLDKVSTLIDLLSAYQDQLPDPVTDALHDLADCDYCEIGPDEVRRLGHIDGAVLSNSAGIDRIISINKVLRRVRVFGGADKHPESFSLYSDDKLLVSW